MLHAQNEVAPALVEVGEDVLQMDFAQAGFESIGNAGQLQVTKMVPGLVERSDQTATGQLLMVDVEKDLAGGVVEVLAELERLRDLAEKEPRLALGIDRLEQQEQAFRLDESEAFSQQFQSEGFLLFERERRMGPTGHDGEVARSDSFGGGDGLLDPGQDLLAGLGVRTGKGHLIEGPLRSDEPGLHFKGGESTPDALLQLKGSSIQGEILPEAKSAVGGVADLIDQVGTDDGLEEAGAGGIVESKFMADVQGGTPPIARGEGARAGETGRGQG